MMHKSLDMVRKVELASDAVGPLLGLACGVGTSAPGDGDGADDSPFFECLFFTQHSPVESPIAMVVVNLQLTWQKFFVCFSYPVSELGIPDTELK